MQVRAANSAPPPAVVGAKRSQPEQPSRPFRWLRAPFWALALFTGAKSFVDNPILGSRTLNRAGLHVWRLRAAHALANRRRARLAHLIPAELRDQFDRDGFIAIPNVVPADEFAVLRAQLFAAEFECRSHRQGDTITRRVPFGPEERRRFPALCRLLDSSRWRGIMAYVASSRSRPLYYLQTIFGGAAEGLADPQTELHADTFHPSLKAFYFLTDVGEADRPLTYVAGSHKLNPARIAWEHRKSIDVVKTGDRLSQRGSFRISREEFHSLGLPAPTRFCVPANTLVVVDTCGFHARGDGFGPTTRVELWGYWRGSPFIPWAGLGLSALRPAIGDRRAAFVSRLLDQLDRWGLRKQHWLPGGRCRLTDR